YFGPHRLYQTFGSGEMGGFVAYLHPSDFIRAAEPGPNQERARQRLASVGRAGPFVRLRVATLDGREMPRGEIGALLVRGDTVMTEYWRQPEATARIFASGWLHSGHLATMDDDGYVT